MNKYSTLRIENPLRFNREEWDMNLKYLFGRIIIAD